MIQAIAPCKVNLFLQIVGRNRNNYHLLESLFAFTEFGDVITIEESYEYNLDIIGEFSSQITKNSTTDNKPSYKNQSNLIPQQVQYNDGENSRIGASDNLITKAYNLLYDQYNFPPVNITLTKNIPIGAGLGGGSSDAATTLLILNDMYNLGLTNKELARISLVLGADIPSCIYQKATIVSGIGEHITPIKLPKNELHILLVNPRISLPTPPVFAGYKKNKRRFSPRISGLHNIKLSSNQQFIRFIASKNNDLTASAEVLCPEISNILDLLEQQYGCLLSGMSGSGATCFGIFPSKNTASQSLDNIASISPNYWLQTTKLLKN